MPIATTWTRDRDSSGRERIDDPRSEPGGDPGAQAEFVGGLGERHLLARVVSAPQPALGDPHLQQAADRDIGHPGHRPGRYPGRAEAAVRAVPPPRRPARPAPTCPPDRPGRRAPGIRAGWTTPWPHHAAYPETRLVVPPTDASQHPSWRTTSPLHQQEATPLVEEPSNPSCRRRPGATREATRRRGKQSRVQRHKDANGRDHQRQVGDVVGGQLKLITPLDHRRQLPTPRAAALSCQPRRRRRAVPATSPRRESRMSPRTSR